MHKMAFIVATKDRPADLRKMLQSVCGQTVRPEQIIIVDASTEAVEAVARTFPELNVAYQRHWPPSAAAQRNVGIAVVAPGVDLVGFMDDDIILEPDAVETMLAFWEGASASVKGAGFNLLNVPERSLVGVKQTRWASRLGIYSAEPGGVAASGWQAVTGTVQQDTRVKWLPSTAVVWRREVFAAGGFDPYFEGYSYLEDLDFSYSIGKRHELWIVAAAGFRHYPASGGRVSGYHFGQLEVANRLYVVRKHGLSMARCYLGLGIRLLMTLVGAEGQLSWANIERAAGNVAGLVYRRRM